MSKNKNDEVNEKDIASTSDNISNKEPQANSEDVDLETKESPVSEPEEISEPIPEQPKTDEEQLNGTEDDSDAKALTESEPEELAEPVPKQQVVNEPQTESAEVKALAESEPKELAEPVTEQQVVNESETEVAEDSSVTKTPFKKEPESESLTEPVSDKAEAAEPQTPVTVASEGDSPSEEPALITDIEIIQEESPDADIPSVTSKSKQILLSIISIFLTLIIVASLSYAFKNYNSAKPAQADETTQTAIKPNALSYLKPNPIKASYPEGILEKYKPLYALNPKVVGWLKVPNTAIDTLVTQSKDNTYFLKNDFYGNYTGVGNLFLDYRDGIKELSQNTVIYGHATLGLPPSSSGRYPFPVFCDLIKYKDYRFFIKNPIIEYGTLYADYQWKIVATFMSSTKGSDDNGYYFYYIPPKIADSTFDGYFDQIQQYAYYFTGVDLKSTDKILTLSACTHENDVPGRMINSRLVVVARLLREGESKEIDATKVKNNPNFRRPQAWYNHYGLKNPYLNRENWYS
ncbi:MAG: hypothetical protein WCN92_00420 [Eubacteriales bacterium]